MLRESAQCPDADKEEFQDISRHRFFNTNNLWIRLDRLKEERDQHGGSLPLALITNRKTVDPRDPDSPKVLQLECAMGAAIENFEQSGAVVVTRDRFAPVKTTADLLALRSDAYVVTDDARLVLHESRKGQPPLIELDAAHYKIVDGLERLLSGGVPSLIECVSLKIVGPVEFASGVVLKGDVQIQNEGDTFKSVPAGVYESGTVTL